MQTIKSSFWVAPLVLLVFIGALMFLFSPKVTLPVDTSPLPLRITTSFYPLYFFATEIGGARVRGTTITPPGTEPHDLELTPSDMRNIAESRIIIMNGRGLEVWGKTIGTITDPKRTTVLSVGEQLSSPLTMTNTVDPHVWLSPPLAKLMVEKIMDAMINAAPADESYFRERGAALLARLERLDRAYRDGLSSCARREFVTTHNAFSFLANTYGLTQIPIAGLSPDAEPSAQELAAITETVRTHGITVIFFETLASPKLAETIARETGASTQVLDPIEGILPADRANGEDYVTIMEENLSNLRSALECTPS